MGKRADLPHITRLRVRVGSKDEWRRIPSGHAPSSLPGTEGVKEDHYFLTHIDDIPVPGKVPVTVCVRKEDGVPRLVYIDGGWPTYETWVYDQTGRILGHFPGHMVEKERKDD